MTADVLLVLEGTYPYVRGGVSSWVNQCIHHMQELKFALIFLGSEARAYPETPFYDIPSNVVSLQKYYLFEGEPSFKEEAKISKGEKYAMPMLCDMHASFQEGDRLSPKALDLSTYHASGVGLTYADFLHGKTAWEFICQQYQKFGEEKEFINYFWRVRNMHRPLWDLARICELAPKAKLVHSISTGYAGFLGALIKVSQGIPYLVSEHGIYTLERKIDLLAKEWEERDEEEEHNPWTHFFEILGKYAYQEDEKVVSLFGGYQKLQIEYGANREKTLVIPNGVNLHFGKKLLEARQPKKEKIVCFIGRIVSIKDIKTFIRSINLLRNMVPNIKAWIVGSQDEQSEYAFECSQLVHALSLENVVEFLGQQNIESILPSIDVLVLTSISEGLPLVVVEAFSAGIPVVATDVGACRELIEGKDVADRALGTAGKIVGINSPQDTAEAIAELLKNPDLWKKSQEAALKRVETFYDQEMMWDRYLKLYREIK